MKNKLQEIIDYFKSDENERGEVISQVISEIKELENNFPDEIILEWDEEYLMTLEDFANQFYSKIIEGVCNVVKSYQDELE